MNEWTEYTEGNGPTDTSRPVHVRYGDGHTTFHRLGFDDVAASWVSRVVAYFVLPPYTPAPELLPCRCGGKAILNAVGDYFTIDCSVCVRGLDGLNREDAHRMWNAAQRDDYTPGNTILINTTGKCGCGPTPSSHLDVLAEEPKPEMPETLQIMKTASRAGLLVVKPGVCVMPPPTEYILRSTYDGVVARAEEAEQRWEDALEKSANLRIERDGLRHQLQYPEVKTCRVNYSRALHVAGGPTWTCSECGYTRILENNKFCGNCGGKIERVEK